MFTLKIQRIHSVFTFSKLTWYVYERRVVAFNRVELIFLTGLSLTS